MLRADLKSRLRITMSPTWNFCFFGVEEFAFSVIVHPSKIAFSEYMETGFLSLLHREEYGIPLRLPNPRVVDDIHNHSPGPNEIMMWEIARFHNVSDLKEWHCHGSTFAGTSSSSKKTLNVGVSRCGLVSSTL